MLFPDGEAHLPKNPSGCNPRKWMNVPETRKAILRFKKGISLRHILITLPATHRPPYLDPGVGVGRQVVSGSGTSPRPPAPAPAVSLLPKLVTQGRDPHGLTKRFHSDFPARAHACPPTQGAFRLPVLHACGVRPPCLRPLGTRTVPADSGNSEREEANTPFAPGGCPRWVPGICNATYHKQLIMGDGRGAGGARGTEEGAVAGQTAS